jgi:hypothetical protein
MSKDDMIKLAIQAGWQYAYNDDGYSPLWHFGALVEEAAAEREACAKVCDEQVVSKCLAPLEIYRTEFIAAAIRARGEK